MSPTDLLFDSSPGRPLLAAIEEVDLAERRLRLHARTALHLNNTDFTALQYIERRERTRRAAGVTDIRHYLSISSAAATSSVGRLREAGYVESRPNPQDARARTLHLTATAHHRFDEELAGVRAGLDELVATVEDADEERLVDLLHRVRSILTPVRGLGVGQAREE